MKIYMIGIGGIGMSALAQLYGAAGHTVSGSDRSESPTTKLLAEKGVSIYYEQKAENVPEDADLVVYSDAVPEDNEERQKARAQNIREISYFKALGEISVGKKTVAVAGTHGKTTTTALLVKVFKDTGQNPTAVIGSLVPEFKGNFVLGGLSAQAEDLFVVEACEYRDHLLELSPLVLIVTNLEWDHTDWFKTFDDMQETFRKAMEHVPKEGAIITNPHDPNIAPLLTSVKAKVIDFTKEEVPELHLLGEFNRKNAQAAKAAARYLAESVSEESIDASLASFAGTWRRFEKKGETKNGALVYDDYAHHPTAVKKTLEAVREKFPHKKIVVAFHPHLFSRTRDLMDEFTESFDSADEVIIAPIYAAREEPIAGVTGEVLAEKIRSRGKHASAAISLEEVFQKFKALDAPETVIITMGAGDIYTVGEKLV